MIRTALLGALALWLAAPAAARGERAALPPQRVFAFVSNVDGTELRRLRQVGGRLDVVAPNAYALDVARAVVAGGVGPELAAAARAARVPVWPVVNARTGGSPAIASPRWRRRVAAAIARVARAHRHPGMTLDVEELLPEQRDDYTALVRAVAARLTRQGRRLAVYSPRPGNRFGAGYDWPALAATADLLIVSGYNEHAAATEPGPVSTAAGFAAVLTAAGAISRTRVAPAVGAFGYRWPADGGRGRLISTRAALRLRGRCFPASRSTPFRCGRTVIHFETTRTLRARRRAAAAAGFRWLALFSLGREPLGFWRPG